MSRKRARGDRRAGVRESLAGRALTLSLAAICLLAIGTARVSASPPLSGTRERPCKVGGPPAWSFWRIPPGVKRLSPIVTIACGRRLLGRPYEIVAVDTSQGLWAYADSGPVGFSEGTSVLPDAPPSTVTAQSAWAGPPARTHLFGVLGTDVASVEVIFHYRGRRERVVRRPTTALVDGETSGQAASDRAVRRIRNYLRRLCASEGRSGRRVQRPRPSGRECAPGQPSCPSVQSHVSSTFRPESRVTSANPRIPALQEQTKKPAKKSTQKRPSSRRARTLSLSGGSSTEGYMFALAGKPR